MSHTKATVLLAGLAMGLGGTAIAQTSSLDEARSFAAETRSDASRATLGQGTATGPQVFGLLQFQYNVTIINDSGPDGEDFANGFQNRRARLGARGEVGDFDYYVQGNFDVNGGDFTLLDYRVSVPVPGMEDDAKFIIGQFKSPFLYEELVSAGSQLAVDRSFVNGYFSQGRSQGISFVYAGNEDDDYKVEVNFSDGFRSANTGFDSPSEADFAIGGRFDYKMQGAWSDFQDFTATQDQEQALRFGGAVFYQAGGNTYAAGGATNDVDALSITADGQWESRGINVYGAFIFQDIDAPMVSMSDIGFIAQAGYRFDENQEVFGRFDYLLADADGVDDFVSLTFGYNYYIYGDQSAKFTADAFFIFETVNNTYFAAGLPNQGLLPDAGDPQAGIRTQFQLNF